MWLLLPSAILVCSIALNTTLTLLPAKTVAPLQLATIGGVAVLVLFVLLLCFYGISIETAAGLLLYFFGMQLYIFILTLHLSSVSVNLLSRLRSQALSESQLDEVYGATDMIQTRIGRLVHAGLLRIENDAVVTTSFGKSLAWLFLRLRAFFCHS